MASRNRTSKLAATVISASLSLIAFFGHDAWAPEPARLSSTLWLSSNSYTASAVGTEVGGEWAGAYTGAGVRVYYLESTWKYLPKGPGGGTPCVGTQTLYTVASSSDGQYYLEAGTLANTFVERRGNYARCIPWVTEGAVLADPLKGPGSSASATEVLSGQSTTVVQFSGSWTYNTTLEAETYWATGAAPAGETVGSIIVRSGDYAKCSS